jgi:Cellulase (glycosyl hydrolase family 5)
MFKVQPNKTIALDGVRFVARGIQMFDYLLVSFETNRINYNYRKIYSPADKYPNTLVSEPTYYAKSQYKNSAYVLEQLSLVRDLGCNLIRVNIEPAIRYASVDYIDPVDGLTYPPDMTMLDVIINHAASLNIAVQLQNSNDTGSTGENVTFLAWLAGRYKTQWNVWINPANEINGMNNGAINVNNAVLWDSMQSQYVNAIRGAGFTNPICLDPCGWGERIDLVATYLNNNAVFKNDANLIIQPHYYPAANQDDFRTDKLITAGANAQWANYIPSYCVLVGEVGIDNLAGRLDPNLDAGIASVSATNWANAQAAVTDFLKWANEQTLFTCFNGCIGHMWGAYIPGLGYHDDNSMRKNTGTWTTWGLLYRNNYLSPPVFNLSQLVTNVPALQGAKMSNATIGTPDFQIEGKSGVKAAGAIITPNGASPILGFLRRDTGALIGTISSNSTGVSYGTTSDYRLKQDLAEISETEILAFMQAIHPVMATWKNSDIREPVLIAHELQALLPSAVNGVKNGSDYQTVDYAKPMAMVLAALKYLINNKN